MTKLPGWAWLMMVVLPFSARAQTDFQDFTISATVPANAHYAVVGVRANSECNCLPGLR